MAPVQRGETVVVEGLAPLLRDFSKISKTATKALRRELRLLAEPVKVDIMLNAAQEGFGRPTVQGVRIYVRQRGVNVEQSLRKSSNLARRRKNFGPLEQKEAFDTGLAANAATIAAGTDAFMDKLLSPVEGSLL